MRPLILTRSFPPVGIIVLGGLAVLFIFMLFKLLEYYRGYQDVPSYAARLTQQQSTPPTTEALEAALPLMKQGDIQAQAQKSFGGDVSVTPLSGITSHVQRWEVRCVGQNEMLLQMAFKDFLAFLKGAWSLHDVHFQRADLGGHAVVEGCWVISQKSDAAQGQKTWGQVIDDQNILSEESISHL